MTLTLTQINAIVRLLNLVGQTMTPSQIRKGLKDHSLDLYFTLEEINQEVEDNNKALELESLEIA